MEKLNTKRQVPGELPRLTARDMLRPLFRHRRIVLVTFSGIFALSILVAVFWASRYYTASMQVVVGRERLEPTLTSQPTAAVQQVNPVVTNDDVASEAAILQGRDMLREVVQTCKLAEPKPSFWDRFDSRSPDARKTAALEKATAQLAGGLKVDSQKSSHVIDVRYGSTNPPESTACVLQTLGQLYLKKHLQLQRPAGAYDFFAQETEKYQQALQQSETELVKFSETTGVAAPEVLRMDAAQQLTVAQANLYQTHQAIAADKRRIENIQEQMATTPSRSATSEASVSANLLLDHLHAALLDAELKRTQLLMKYDASYPLVKEVEQEIEQTKEALAKAEAAKYVNTTTDRDQTYELLRQDQARTEADLAADQAKAQALSNTIRDMQLKMVDLDVKAVHRAALVREAKANEDNYLLYLTKREQERTSDALDEKRMANVAIAVPATVPVLPAHSPFAVILTGFILGLFVSIAAGYLAELADPSFRSPSEVEETLNIPILAAVPKRVA